MERRISMFDRKLFTYNEETHTGFYNGELVPSTTQLISLLYPLDERIPEKNLKQAATRGTEIHARIEKINDELIGGKSIKDLYVEEDMLEGAQYLELLNAYSLVPVMAEKQVFLLDENGDLICYGHFDFVCECVKSNELFNCLDYYLMDLKTTSAFDKKKTALQTQVYRIALNQEIGETLNGKTCGVWLRDEKANIYPFIKMEDSNVINLMKMLKEKYDTERKRPN